MTKQKVLFLDDMPERHSIFKRSFSEEFDIDHVYNYEDCIKHLQECSYDMVFLDHDLSRSAIMCDPDNATEPTGTTVAKWIVEHEIKIPDGAVLHSLNPAGRERMFQILTDAGYKALAYPFTSLVWQF